MDKKFKTKTGYCHIFDDKIVLTKNEFIENVSEDIVGNKIYKTFLVYGLIAAVLFYFAFDNYVSDKLILSGLLICLGIYLIYGILSSLNNSSTPVIFREKIKEIKFIKGFKGLTRSRFEVNFLDENQKLKKRLIMLPGSLSDGEIETGKALKLFKEEKLIVN